MTLNRSLLIALLVACAIAGLAVAEVFGKDSWGKDAWGKSSPGKEAASQEPRAYPFTKSPTEALQATSELRFADEPIVFEPSAAEQSLSEWVQLGKLTDDQWAEASMDQRDWSAAIRIYTLGQESFPDNSLFRQNIRYCEQRLQGK